MFSGRLQVFWINNKPIKTRIICAPGSLFRTMFHSMLPREYLLIEWLLNCTAASYYFVPLSPFAMKSKDQKNNSKMQLWLSLYSELLFGFSSRQRDLDVPFVSLLRFNILARILEFSLPYEMHHTSNIVHLFNLIWKSKFWKHSYQISSKLNYWNFQSAILD